MPHLLDDNRVAFYREEVAGNDKFMTVSRFEKLVYRDFKIGRFDRSCFGNKALYNYDDLEQYIKDALVDPRQDKNVLDKYYRTKEARVVLTKYQLPDGSYLDLDYQDKIIINASVLQAAICLRYDVEKERKHKGLNMIGITEVLLNHTIDFQKTLKLKHQCQHTLPKSLKRFKQVLKDFEKLGYVCLISRKLGNSNSRKVTDETLAILKSLFVSDRSKPDPTEVHRRYSNFLSGKIEIVNNGTGELYNPNEFKKLSDSTVKKYLTSWSVMVGASLIRNGDRQKQMGLFKPYVKFEKTKYAGSLISIDDRQVAITMPDGKRIWLYVAIDVASEAYVCIVHCKTKEGIILNFYRQLVRNYADWTGTMPNGLECESSLNSQFLNTFLAEGAMFENVRIEANNARGKLIERNNRSMKTEIEKPQGNLQARPFARSESNQAGTHEIKPMHYDEIVRLCYKNYEDWNMLPHSVHAHLSRWEVFMQMQHPDLKPINYNAILPHLGQKTPTSCNVGSIRLRGGEYWLGENGKIVLGKKLIDLMKKVEGQDVIVYWLDDNDGGTLKALVYIGTQLICEAIQKPTYPRAVIERKPEHKEIIELVHSYISTIEAYGRRSKNEIERVTVINNTPIAPRTFTMPGQYRDKINTKPTGELLPEPEYLDYKQLSAQDFKKVPLKDRI
jgi:hypothetical protein